MMYACMESMLSCRLFVRLVWFSLVYLFSFTYYLFAYFPDLDEGDELDKEMTMMQLEEPRSEVNGLLENKMVLITNQWPWQRLPWDIFELLMKPCADQPVLSLRSVYVCVCNHQYFLA